MAEDTPTQSAAVGVAADLLAAAVVVDFPVEVGPLAVVVAAALVEHPLSPLPQVGRLVLEALDSGNQPEPPRPLSKPLHTKRWQQKAP